MAMKLFGRNLHGSELDSQRLKFRLSPATERLPPVAVTTGSRGKTKTHASCPGRILTLPPIANASTSASPPGPFSSTDLIGSYNNDSARLPNDDRDHLRRSPHHMDSLLDRRRSNGQSKSFNFSGKGLNEKERESKHRDDHILPLPSGNKAPMRSNGLRSNFNSSINSHSSSQKQLAIYPQKDGDDLVAMGTNTSQLRTGGPRGAPPAKKANSRCSLLQSQLPMGRQREAEPRYADPYASASPSFQQRVAEMNALEQDTVRWERAKKLKKKTKE